jgi:hypothetical protein
MNSLDNRPAIPPFSTVENIIANRDSWLKIGVVAAVTILGGIKFLNVPLNIDLSKFDFSDFLSLILAIFSIGLSVAFYFKANDDSGKFYDNTYKFTKEVSEILGRIEAGFGERLRHLDEGYSGLRTRFEQLPIDLRNAEKEVQDEEQNIEKKEEERTKLIEELAKKAKLQEGEKEDLLKRLQQMDAELYSARRELTSLQQSLFEAEHPTRYPRILTDSTHQALSNYAKQFDGKVLSFSPADHLQKIFNPFLNAAPNSILRELARCGLLDGEKRFSPSGVRFLRSFAQLESK